jgi:hypothetical protein
MTLALLRTVCLPNREPWQAGVFNLFPIECLVTSFAILFYEQVRTAMKKRVFRETTPLGHQVVLTRDRWREIVRIKHPALAGYEASVRECIRDPEVIRASAKDPDVHLYYRLSPTGYTCVVVGGDDPDDRCRNHGVLH